MTKRSYAKIACLVAAAAALLAVGSSTAVAQGVQGAGPADPPPGWNRPSGEILVPSVVKGQKAGIELGQFAPDFKLEPIEEYPILEKWLGDKAPKTADELVPLAQLVGKVPVMLLFGSYT